ncbi:hypothetical protein F5Y03DRAFT_349135 [Xylaria venustula]|nr:hypothetical protein F5Y03DRAFT_349135 [Xylaria venustula]
MQSQPLPGAQSQYFSNGYGNRPASQTRGRLSPLPHHPPRASAFPRSSMSPFPSRPQPYPLFVSSPGTTGYVPQHSTRYYRNPGLQQPLRPLRVEFAARNSVHDVDRPVTFHGIGPPRPYSVPAQNMQSERSSREIPRPASVAHTRTETSLHLQALREGQRLGLSPPTQDAPEDQCAENDFMPPKRILPFPKKNRAKVQSTQPETEGETTTTKSLSSKVVPSASKQVDKGITGESRSESNQKTIRDHPDTNPDGVRALKRPKITFTNWRTPQHGNNTAASASPTTQVKKSLSQESQPSQIPSENAQGDSISRASGSVTENVGASATYATIPSLINPSHPRPAPVGLGAELEKPLVAPIIAPQPSPSTMVDPCLVSSYLDESCKSEASQKSLFGADSIRDKLSQVHPDIPNHKVAKRSASQATTVTSTSTEIPCAMRNQHTSKVKDACNQMSMIDVTIVLQRSIRDIVKIRLQQGNAGSLGALGGEILIKMAIEDEELGKAVEKALES